MLLIELEMTEPIMSMRMVKAVVLFGWRKSQILNFEIALLFVDGFKLLKAIQLFRYPTNIYVCSFYWTSMANVCVCVGCSFSFFYLYLILPFSLSHTWEFLLLWLCSLCTRIFETLVWLASFSKLIYTIFILMVVVVMVVEYR